MPFPYLFPFYFSEPDRAFTIWIDGTDETSRTLVGASLSYSFGSVGTLNISFESGVSIALGTEIKVFDINLNTFIFSGAIRDYTYKQQTHNRYIIECIAHDWTKEIYDSTGITGTFSGTEKGIITELFNTYCPTVIIGSGVVTGNTTSLTLEDNSLSEALDILADENSRVWSVDPLIELQYGATGNWAAALFNLSDSPDFSTSYPYFGFEYSRDNISTTGNIDQVSLKTYYSGLKVGTYVLLTNAVIGAPFTPATYYIINISARLLNTIDTNIRWEFTIGLRDSSTLPDVTKGLGNKDNFVSRLRNTPAPTKGQEPATKKYVDTKTHGIGIIAIDATTDITVADGHAYIPIPATFNGMNLTRAQAMVITAGTTNATTIDIYNVTDSVDMLSTAISIASGETVGTVGTINTANDAVATNDVLRVDVTTVSTTAPKGLLVTLEAELP